MSYSKLIHDYLDGELTTSQQDLLFSELAHNIELRQEFNQQVRLQTLAQSDLPSLTPPAEAANQVFSKLGFNIPNSDFAKHLYLNKSAEKAFFWKSTVEFFKKRFPTILTSVVSATITALLFLYFLNNYSSNINPSTNGLNRNVISNTLSDLQVPKSSGNLSDNRLTNNLTEDELQKLFAKALENYFAENPIKSNVFYASDSKNRDLLDNNKNESLTQNNQTQNTTNQNSYQNQFPFVWSPNPSQSERKLNLSSPEPNSIDIPDDFALLLRGFSTQSSTKVNVPSNANPWFNNMALSFAYNFDKHHSLGLEIGQEQFAQRFQKTEYDLTTTWEQNPLLFWYGAFYRFSYPELIFSEKLFPFAQIFGGATSVGPIFKSQIGLQYKPDKRVTFVLGGEFTRLIYSFQNNIYNSDKFGITYGISIQY